jgi:hypothetical protein
MESSISNVLSHVVLVSQLEDKLHDQTQGENLVLWLGLDHIDPLVLSHSGCVVAANKWVKGKEVLNFLKGWNPKFESGWVNLMQGT